MTVFSANGSAVHLGFGYRLVWFGLHLRSDQQPCSCPERAYEDAVGDYCDDCRSRYTFFDGPVGDYSRWSRLHPLADSPCIRTSPEFGGEWYGIDCDKEQRSVCQQG